MKKKVSKKFVEMGVKMEEQGDFSFVRDLTADQMVDYIFKRFDLSNKLKNMNNLP